MLWNARQILKKYMYRSKMCLVLQFGMNSLYVMVVPRNCRGPDLPYSEDYFTVWSPIFKIVCGHYVAVKWPCEGIVGYTVKSLVPFTPRL